MREITKRAITEWANGLPDKELEMAFYDSVFDSLGSEVEEMYEMGYEISDIKEQEELEKYFREKSLVLQTICQERGIKLWAEIKNSEE
jgi:hypothetical protein